jgi:uncharacterized membrane protein AbrB (regulator of aidB expression)
MTKLIQHIFLIPLLASAYLSLKAFRLRWPKEYRFFSILLILLFVIESFNILWKYFLHNAGTLTYSNNSAWLYNFSFIPQYLLYMLVFYNGFSNKSYKQYALWLGLPLCIFILLNIFFIQGIFMPNTISLIVADSIMILLCFLYFDQMAIKKKSLKKQSWA